MPAHDVHVVGRDQQVSHQGIDGLVGLAGRGGRGSGRESNRVAGGGLGKLLLAGQRQVEHGHGNAADLQAALLGPLLQQAGRGRRQQGIGLLQVAGDVDQENDGLLARLRLDHRRCHLAPRHPFEIIERQAESLPQIRPMSCISRCKSLRKAAMIELLDEPPQLGLLPMNVQGIDVADGQKADGLLRKKRFAGPGSLGGRHAKGQ